MATQKKKSALDELRDYVGGVVQNVGNTARSVGQNVASSLGKAVNNFQKDYNNFAQSQKNNKALQDVKNRASMTLRDVQQNPNRYNIFANIPQITQQASQTAQRVNNAVLDNKYNVLGPTNLRNMVKQVPQNLKTVNDITKPYNVLANIPEITYDASRAAGAFNDATLNSRYNILAPRSLQGIYNDPAVQEFVQTAPIGVERGIGSAKVGIANTIGDQKLLSDGLAEVRAAEERLRNRGETQGFGEWTARGLAMNGFSFVASLGAGAVVGAAAGSIGGPVGAAVGTIAGILAAGGTSYVMNSGDVYIDAIQHGADPETAKAVAIGAGGVMALLDTMPIASLLRRTPGGQLVLKKIVMGVLRSAAEEATTESMQEIIANVAAKEYYDHQRDILQGVPESMYFGALMGGGGSVITDVAISEPTQTTDTSPSAPEGPRFKTDESGVIQTDVTLEKLAQQGNLDPKDAQALLETPAIKQGIDAFINSQGEASARVLRKMVDRAASTGDVRGLLTMARGFMDPSTAKKIEVATQKADDVQSGMIAQGRVQVGAPSVDSSTAITPETLAGTALAPEAPLSPLQVDESQSPQLPELDQTGSVSSPQTTQSAQPAARFKAESVTPEQVEQEFNLTPEEATAKLRQIFSPDEVGFLVREEGSIMTPEGQFARGRYLNSLIEVVNMNGLVSDLDVYHESFHAYVDKFANQELFNQALSEVKTEQGFTSDLQAEEYLADQFADYMAQKSQPKGRVRAFFDSLVASLKAMFKRVDAAEQLFTDILNHRKARQQELLALKAPDRPELLESGTNLNAFQQALTTKVMKKLDGKTSVNRQFIEELIKNPSVKAAEKDVLTAALGPATLANGKVNVAAFMDQVQRNLVPLKATETGGQYSQYRVNTDDAVGYQNVVFELPFTTKGADAHFSGQGINGYFAHARTDLVPDNSGDYSVMRVNEIQSDLFQRGRWKKEFAEGDYGRVSQFTDFLERSYDAWADGVYGSEEFNKYIRDEIIASGMTKGDLEAINELIESNKQNVNMYQSRIDSGLVRRAEALENINRIRSAPPEQRNELSDELRETEENYEYINEQIANAGLSQDKARYRVDRLEYVKELLPDKTAEALRKEKYLTPYKGDGWWQRTVRELISYAAKNGATKLRLPTGSTVAFVEQYLSDSGVSVDGVQPGEYFSHDGTDYYALTSGDSGVYAVPESQVRTFEYEVARNEEIDSRSSDIVYEVETNNDEFRKANIAERMADDGVRQEEIDAFLEDSSDYPTSATKDLSEYAYEVAESEINESYSNAAEFAEYFSDMTGEKYVAVDDDTIARYSESDEEFIGFQEEFDKTSFDDVRDRATENRGDDAGRVMDFYEKDIRKYLQRIRPDMRVVTDDKGFSWYEVELSPDDAVQPVEAFKLDKGRKVTPRILEDQEFLAGREALEDMFAAGEISRGEYTKQFAELVQEYEGKYATQENALRSEVETQNRAKEEALQSQEESAKTTPTSTETGKKRTQKRTQRATQEANAKSEKIQVPDEVKNVLAKKTLDETGRKAKYDKPIPMEIWDKHSDSIIAAGEKLGAIRKQIEGIKARQEELGQQEFSRVFGELKAQEVEARREYARTKEAMETEAGVRPNDPKRKLGRKIGAYQQKIEDAVNAGNEAEAASLIKKEAAAKRKYSRELGPTNIEGEEAVQIYERMRDQETESAVDQMRERVLKELGKKPRRTKKGMRTKDQVLLEANETARAEEVKATLEETQADYERMAGDAFDFQQTGEGNGAIGGDVPPPPTEFEADPKDPRVRARKKRRFQAIMDILYTSSREQLRNEGPTGARVADMIDDMYRGEQKDFGSYMSRYYEVARPYLKKKQFEQIAKALDGRADRPLTPAETEVVAKLRGVLDGIATQAQTLGLKVQRPDGTKVEFQPRGNFFPHKVDVRLLKKNQAMVIDHLVQTGQVKDRATAESIVKAMSDEISEYELVGTYFPRTERNDHLEYSRIFDLPPSVLRYDSAVLPEYFLGVAHRLNQVIQFGQNNENVNTLVESVSKDKGNPAKVRRILEQNLGMSPDTYGIRQNVSRILKLEAIMDLEFAAAAQFTQIGNPIVAYGLRNTIKGAIKSLNRQNRGLSLDAGATADQILGMIEKKAGRQRLSSRLIAPGMNQFEYILRSMSSLAGREAAIEAAQNIAKNPDNARAKFVLQFLGIDPAAAVQQGGQLTEDQLSTATLYGAEKTQFKNRAIETPITWNTDIGRILTQYKFFAKKQGDFMNETVVREARRGNFTPLFLALVFFQVLGELTNDIRALLRGQDRPEGLSRVIDNYGATLGIAYDLARSFQYGLTGMYSFVLGPAVSKGIKYFDNVVNKGVVKGNWNPFFKQATNDIPLVGGLLANRLFADQKPQTGIQLGALTPSTPKLSVNSPNAPEALAAEDPTLGVYDDGDLSARERETLEQQRTQINKRINELGEAEEGWSLFGWQFGQTSDEMNAEMEKLTAQKETIDRVLAVEKLLEFKGEGLEAAKNKYDMYSAARSIYGDRYLTQDTKDGLYKRMGLNPEEVQYDYYANIQVQPRADYLYEILRPMENKEMLATLITFRKESLSGDMLASDGVINELVERGLITEGEGKYLKKFKYDINGKAIEEGGTGSGKKKKKGPTLKLKPTTIKSTSSYSTSSDSEFTTSYRGAKPVKLNLNKIKSTRVSGPDIPALPKNLVKPTSPTYNPNRLPVKLKSTMPSSYSGVR